MKKEKKEQISVFLAEEEVEELVDKLVEIPEFKKIPASNEFEILRGILDDSLIIIYRSGKLVYQKNEKVRNLLESMFLEKLKEDGLVVGSDEAGKGEAIGPLTVAAVALLPKQAAYLKSIGVTDSKLVSDERIQRLAKEIIKNCEAKKVLVISPKKFNEIFEKFSAKGLGLNDILAVAHSKVLNSVIRKLKNKSFRVIVDEFDSSKEKTKIKWIESRIKVPNVYSLVEAEAIPAVASASILARNAYLSWINRNVGDIKEIRNNLESYISKVGYNPKIFKLAYLQSLIGKK